MPAASTASLSIPKIRWGEIFRSIARHLVVVKPLGEALPEKNPWQRYWGGTYGPELKRWLLKPVFEELESAGKLGELIVDVGSGAEPVTSLPTSLEGRKRILVDIAADNGQSANEQRIRFDAERVDEPGTLGFRKALVRVSGFLKFDPRAMANGRGADTMVFSDLLNYVDFRKVLAGFARFLKPGGRMIVVNLPMRGNEALFSDKGLKDNRELCGFLEEEGFEIERKSFPKRAPGSHEEAEELIVLVARKVAAAPFRAAAS